ncbi:MAG: hypothetical protein KIT83_03220 [Bryobacterales bacterium]|nr:hypothetical protein [Bryobacterales bacterium]
MLYAVRDAAYRSAYLWFSGLVLSGNLYANVATSKRLAPYLWMPAEATEWQLTCGTLVFLCATLPQAFIAWREPDFPEEFAIDRAA